jgi:hypothetical protein
MELWWEEFDNKNIHDTYSKNCPNVALSQIPYGMT